MADQRRGSSWLSIAIMLAVVLVLMNLLAGWESRRPRPLPMPVANGVVAVLLALSVVMAIRERRGP